MENKNLWWGYLHINGSIHPKRYFGESDLAEAYESPFVKTVVHQFWAANREEALETIKKELLEKIIINEANLSPKDIEIILKGVINPSEPNEALKKAHENYLKFKKDNIS